MSMVGVRRRGLRFPTANTASSRILKLAERYEQRVNFDISKESALLSRYYALVLVPGKLTREEAGNAALELLYPYMYNPHEPTKAHNFDYVYSPEDIADLTDDDFTDHVWPVNEILEWEALAELQVEAIVTSDGAWHEPDDLGQLWDDPVWLEKARPLLEVHRESLALRHVLHI
jgi:hypothetical protein